jgi:Class III cytochrome C family/Cytochrome c7 and related cytochrome c
MTKKVLVILLLITFFTLTRDGGLFPEASGAQKKAAPSATPDYSKFTHESHRGRVKSLIVKDKNITVDCAYCHGTIVKDKKGPGLHDMDELGYPSKLNGFQKGRTHSACIECHAFTGPQAPLAMCTICHSERTPDQTAMRNNIRRFPDSEIAPRSEFFDSFSHDSHVDYYNQNILNTDVKKRFKFFDPKNKEPNANKGLDKDKFECMTCHTANPAPVTVGRFNFGTQVKMSMPGHPQCFSCHYDPKIVTPPDKTKPNPKNTFATECVGCHYEQGKPFKDGRPVLGSEHAVVWFDRQIVNTEFNPVRPGVKSPLPYSHKTHFKEIKGSTVKDCLSCHVTGKTAVTRSDFYLADKRTKEKQPLIWTCVECHKQDGMQTKVQGTMTLERSKCNYCHSLQTIREYGKKGIQLPPPNHFYVKPAQPVLANNAAPAQPATADGAAAGETGSSGDAVPPTASGVPGVPGFPITNEMASRNPGKPQTMPKMPRLGDPKEIPFWGLDEKWGVVENFDHDTHITPKYSKNCEECHHTNKDAKAEMEVGLVPLCTGCHKGKDNPANPLNKDQEPIDVEIAYHGNPNNSSNNAGCIECHKRYYENNPDLERKAPTTKCQGCHVEKISLFELPRRYDLRNQWPVKDMLALIRGMKR